MGARVELDGSRGEGGGQILRSALAFSMLTARPFVIDQIRARRDPPGLRPQHLEAVRAARQICTGRVSGAEIGSRRLCFEPGPVRAGSYRFTIPTAGSSSLVLQTVQPALAAASAGSEVVVTGGTHVIGAPSFDFLAECWAPALKRLGLTVSLELIACGFYPRGGGELRARIEPARALDRLEWLARGELVNICPRSMVARLPRSIAERQAHRAQERLRSAGLADRVADAMVWEGRGGGPGTMLGLRCRFEAGQSYFYALGAKGKRAETVADEAVDALLAFLAAPEAAVDAHLADQLLLPMAAFEIPGRFTTDQVTRHLETNIDVIGRFLGPCFELRGSLGEPGSITMTLSGASRPLS